MPRGDGMGPAGAGPMTGRGAGFCAGYSVPGYMNPGPGFGRGYGFGRGRGFGFGRGYGYGAGRGPGFGRGRGFRRTYNYAGAPWWGPYGYGDFAGYEGATATGTDVDEKVFLRNEAEYLEDQIKQVKERLKALESETE